MDASKRPAVVFTPVRASVGPAATMVNRAETSVPKPLVAVIVNEDVPRAVGVPETTPVAESNTRPAGRLPADSVIVGVGDPLAVIGSENGVPTTA